MRVKYAFVCAFIYSIMTLVKKRNHIGHVNLTLVLFLDVHCVVIIMISPCIVYFLCTYMIIVYIF